MTKTDLLGLEISGGTYRAFVDRIINLALQRKSNYICVANVHMLVEAHYHKEFAKVVNQAAMVTPDGKPLTWAMKYLLGVKQERVAGMDILPDILELATVENLPIYFYGGEQSMLSSTEAFLQKNYPGINIVGLDSPPFHALSEMEEFATIQRINNSGAAIVMVILGCPKQEKWMASMKNKINALMIGVGGALPVMIGLQKRAPNWMQAAGLEWLYRLVQEPKRLFKRYFITNSAFIFLFCKALLKKHMLKTSV